jgi:hypothetical protein
MSESIRELARSISESAVSSRRGFLAHAGRGALGLAAGVAGLLATHPAQAAAEYCCFYADRTWLKVSAARTCPATNGNGARNTGSGALVNGTCRVPV